MIQKIKYKKCFFNFYFCFVLLFFSSGIEQVQIEIPTLNALCNSLSVFNIEVMGWFRTSLSNS